MKTAVRVILIILLVGMISSTIGCGKNVEPNQEPVEEQKSKKIELTLENYKDYFETSAYAKNKNSTLLPYSSYDYTYRNVEFTYEVTGNSHYKYNNVYIKLRVIQYDHDEYVKYLGWTLGVGEEMPTPKNSYNDKTITVNVNLAGNGSITALLYNDNLTSKLNADPKEQLVFFIEEVGGTVEEY